MTTKFIKTAILGFVKPLVNKTIYKAFDKILSPCCEPTISNINVECVSTGIYNISFNVGTQWSGSYVSITIGNFYYLTVSPDETVIVDSSGNVSFSNVNLSYIGGADTYSIQLSLSTLVSTETSSVRAVSDILSPMEVTFPSC